MTIQVTVKNVYGNQTIYPACDKSRIFAKMVGQKTLTRVDLENIKALGYAVQVTMPNFGL